MFLNCNVLILYEKFLFLLVEKLIMYKRKMGSVYGLGVCIVKVISCLVVNIGYINI